MPKQTDRASDDFVVDRVRSAVEDADAQMAEGPLGGDVNNGYFRHVAVSYGRLA